MLSSLPLETGPLHLAFNINWLKWINSSGTVSNVYPEMPLAPTIIYKLTVLLFTPIISQLLKSGWSGYNSLSPPLLFKDGRYVSWPPIFWDLTWQLWLCKSGVSKIQLIFSPWSPIIHTLVLALWHMHVPEPCALDPRIHTTCSDHSGNTLNVVPTPASPEPMLHGVPIPDWPDQVLCVVHISEIWHEAEW